MRERGNKPKKVLEIVSWEIPTDFSHNASADVDKMAGALFSEILKEGYARRFRREPKGKDILVGVKNETKTSHSTASVSFYALSR